MGGYAVQVANLLGATVVAAASIGADVVLDISGGQVSQDSLTLLAPFGRFVIGGMASGRPTQLDEAAVRTLFHAPASNQSVRAFNLGVFFGLRPEVAGRALETLTGYVASGQVTVDVGHVLPLTEAARAHRLLEARASVGKIVLRPWA